MSSDTFPHIHAIKFNINFFYHSCRVLITTVNKSTDALPLAFFNNCFDDEDFNNGSYTMQGWGKYKRPL
jgi:hypothetical protein